MQHFFNADSRIFYTFSEEEYLSCFRAMVRAGYTVILLHGGKDSLSQMLDSLT